MASIQNDQQVRVVALTNLTAMCKRASGVCHNYHVVKVTPNRVHVQYSNPDEYGTADPQTASFPCYPNPWGEKDNPFVVLEFVNILNDPEDNAWQNFEPIRSQEPLFRSNPDTDDWKTRAEIEAAHAT
jgi:hypothetical protein